MTVPSTHYTKLNTLVGGTLSIGGFVTVDVNTAFVRTGFDGGISGLKAYAAGNLGLQVDSTGFTLYRNSGGNVAIKGDATGLGFFGVSPVAKPTALTSADASAINSGDGTTDTVIGNMRTRIGELETKLQALGLLT